MTLIFVLMSVIYHISDSRTINYSSDNVISFLCTMFHVKTLEKTGTLLPLWQCERKNARLLRFSFSKLSAEIVGYSLNFPVKELILSTSFPCNGNVLHGGICKFPNVSSFLRKNCKIGRKIVERKESNIKYGGFLRTVVPSPANTIFGHHCQIREHDLIPTTACLCCLF